jgi:hypothetical protein
MFFAPKTKPVTVRTTSLDVCVLFVGDFISKLQGALLKVVLNDGCVGIGEGEIVGRGEGVVGLGVMELLKSFSSGSA